MTPVEIVGFGLATGAGMAYLYTAGTNWRALWMGFFHPGERRQGMVLIAGPVLLLALVQGLLMAGADLSGRAVAAVLLAGLALDPAALPVAVFGAYRWFRNRRERRG